MSGKINLVIYDETSQKEKFFCDYCNLAFETFEDFNKRNTYGCCQECYMTFVESRKKEWKDGWRNSKKELKEYNYLKR